jgi:DNA-binding MarR family transcriptional regulator
LRKYYTSQKEVEAPQAVTQKGIADAIEIRVTHVPRSVKRLEEEGLIYETVMHVKGLDKRRKAYFLTEKGMYNANEIKRGLEERKVTLKDLKGNINDLKIAEIENKTGIKLDLLDMVKLIDREGILNQSSMELVQKNAESEAAISESTIFDFPHKVPVPEEFVGRKDEVAKLKKWISDDETILVSIHGETGIGKSALVADVLSEIKDEKNVFWFAFGKGEVFEDMLDHLSEFFIRQNRGELKSAVRAKDKGLGEILKALTVAAAQTNPYLVFDALDEADDKSKRFFSLLAQDIDDFSGSKIIILHRSRPKDFVSEVAGSDYFKDLRLEGLDKKSCESILGIKKLKKDEFERIFTLTEGNPKQLMLIRSEEIKELKKSGKYTADELTLIRYLRSLDKI